MLKTSMSDYEKSSVVTYPFYFINRQSIHKTNCMQRIKKVLMWVVFPAIALNVRLLFSEYKIRFQDDNVFGFWMINKVEKVSSIAA